MCLSDLTLVKKVGMKINELIWVRQQAGEGGELAAHSKSNLGFNRINE